MWKKFEKLNNNKTYVKNYQNCEKLLLWILELMSRCIKFQIDILKHVKKVQKDGQTAWQMKITMA